VTADVFLLADETKTSVSAVCRTLELPRSTIYARRGREPSARAKDTAVLDVEIRAEFERRKRRYGSPRVHRSLRRNGRRVSRKRIAARMQAMNLQARRPKRFRRTTKADETHVPAPNLLDRRFDNWDEPNRAWVGDITYIWTLAGWVYLAVLVDLCTRGIVGWAVSPHCDAELARQALDRAVARHRPGRDLIHHTDRGSTYTAAHYRTGIKAYGMLESMSRKGNCWDNAVAESTFSTIKTELFGDIIPEDIHAVQRMLFPYIERFYNRERLHSSIGYITPAEKELLTTNNALVA
jgi:transposase InsO family protein